MIEVARFVNISSSPFDNDIYDVMAGGASYMQTFAGGSIYSGLVVPQSNPKSVLGQYAFSKTALMLGLQEDYVQLALMPIQLQSFLSDREVRVVTLTIYNVIAAYIKVTSGKDISINPTTNEMNISTSELAEIAQEMTKDSAIEDLAESFGMAAYGTLGAVIAGSLVGGLLGSGFNMQGNIVENTISTLSGVATSNMVSGIASTLGITSIVGMIAVGMLASTMVSQAVQVALGLKSGFGVGGTLQDVGYGQHTSTYSARLGFLEAVEQALGLKSFNTNFTTNQLGVITSYTSYDSQGRATTHDVSGWGVDVTGDPEANVSDIAGLNTPDSLAGGYFGSQVNDALNGSTTTSGGYTGGTSYGGTNGGRGGDSNGNADGNGHGSDGTIICTALSKYGVFTKRELVEQFKYTKMIHKQETIEAYYKWAKYFVKKIESGKQVKFWSFVMKHRANEIEYRMNKRQSADIVGKMAIFFIDGFSRLYALLKR